MNVFVKPGSPDRNPDLILEGDRDFYTFYVWFKEDIIWRSDDYEARKACMFRLGDDGYPSNAEDFINIIIKRDHIPTSWVEKIKDYFAERDLLG